MRYVCFEGGRSADQCDRGWKFPCPSGVSSSLDDERWKLDCEDSFLQIVLEPSVVGRGMHIDSWGHTHFSNKLVSVQSLERFVVIF